ncbi:MAG TPA: glucose 1-dehydrogenase [Methylomirabilota bacterium]|nr:glucose 1-dehydrogenase [Methylomirabilota bacterium]
MDIRLTGKRALVTGANSGIGPATAIALGAAGARIIVNYIEQPHAADAVVAEVGRRKGEAFALRADVSDQAQVAAMFQQVDRRWGGIDILVNNAATIGEPTAAWEGPPAAWRHVLDVNLVGAYHCAREAMRRMIAQRGGVILTITSVHELLPLSTFSAYSVSKAGLGMLTKSLALEGGPHGVRVVALAPGAIRTRLTESTWSDPQILADAETRIPLGRIGEPEEVARMAVVLCSDAASYVTGTTVFIDGGLVVGKSS